MDIFDQARRTLYYLQDVIQRESQTNIQRYDQPEGRGSSTGFKLVTQRLKYLMDTKSHDSSEIQLSEIEGGVNINRQDEFIQHVVGLVRNETDRLDNIGETDTELVERHCSHCKGTLSSYVCCCSSHTCSVCLQPYCRSCFGYWKSLVSIYNKRQACRYCDVIVNNQRLFHMKVVETLEYGVGCYVIAAPAPSNPYYDDSVEDILKAPEDYSSHLWFDMDECEFYWHSIAMVRNKRIFTISASIKDIKSVKKYNEHKRIEIKLKNAVRIHSLLTSDENVLRDRAVVKALLNLPSQDGSTPYSHLITNYYLGQQSMSATDESIQPMIVDKSKWNLYIIYKNEKDLNIWFEAINNAWHLLVPESESMA